MKHRRSLFATGIALMTLASGIATENDRLTREERTRVGHLYAEVMRDEEVKKARRAHEETVRHYHEELRKAMIERDPAIEPALAKIRLNPGLLAEAIWQKRNKDVLKNLHLPLKRLDAEDRERWNRAMAELRKKPSTKAFGKRLEDNYREQAKLRQKQTDMIRTFKENARRKLVEIDAGLKPVLEKLEGRPPLEAEPPKDDGKVNVDPPEAPLNPGGAGDDPKIITPMPMPAPTPEGCL